MAASEIASNHQSSIINHQSSIINHQSNILRLITTTEIYLHVATGEHGLGVVSPLDRLFVCREKVHAMSA